MSSFIENKNAILYDYFMNENGDLESRVLVYIVWRTHEPDKHGNMICTDTQTYIAKFMNVSQARISVVMANLESEGYITRHQVFSHNGYFKAIHLTKKLEYSDISKLELSKREKVIAKYGKSVNSDVSDIESDDSKNDKDNYQKLDTNKDSKDSLNISNSSYENEESILRKKELERVAAGNKKSLANLKKGTN